MVDIGKQIEHWRLGADEDWQVAVELIQHGRIRHGLFFVHLAVEKTLKALVCRTTKQLAPPIHNLSRLAELTDIPLEEHQRDLLAEVNSFNIEGRYPEMLLPTPSHLEAEDYINRIGDLLACLQKRF
jgi:HEPN domain-containing protein